MKELITIQISKFTKNKKSLNEGTRRMQTGMEKMRI